MGHLERGTHCHNLGTGHLVRGGGGATKHKTGGGHMPLQNGGTGKGFSHAKGGGGQTQQVFE